jgi:hypothetical protein
MNAQSFTECVLRELRKLNPDAEFLAVRARGKSAVIGYSDNDEWVPIFRLVGGSAAFNVANLQVRHRNRWDPTFIRGVPKDVASELAGNLSFIWEIHARSRLDG